MKTNNLVRESKKHKLKLIRGLSSAIVIFLIFLTLGAFVYSAVEKWDYLDSLYFTVITVTNYYFHKNPLFFIPRCDHIAHLGWFSLSAFFHTGFLCVISRLQTARLAYTVSLRTP